MTTRKTATLDEMVAAVRADSTVGRCSLSVIDECFSDDELRALFSSARLRSTNGALALARQIDHDDRSRYDEIRFTAW